jgi:hypothetical protein
LEEGGVAASEKRSKNVLIVVPLAGEELRCGFAV